MAINETTLLQSAGLSALVAIPALILSGITIALFFGGAGDFWGPINDIAVAVTLGALVLPVVAVAQLTEPDAGAWFRIVTVVAIAGIAVAAVGQVLLVLGVISLQTSFVTGGVGILPVFAWLISLVILSLGQGILPAQIGWLSVGVVGLSAALAVAANGGINPVVVVVSVAMLAVIAAWMGSLGTTLMSRAVAAG